MRRISILVMLSLLLALSLQSSTARSLRLAWDPNPEQDVAGYRLYRGTASGTYDQSVDVGNTTTNSLDDLQEGTTYYFAVTAYNSLGLESGFSNEVSYTVPEGMLAEPPRTAQPSILGIVQAGYGVVITWASQPGESYRVLFKDRLDDPHWTDVSGDLSAIGSKTTWADTTSPNAHQKFYAVAQLDP